MADYAGHLTYSGIMRGHGDAVTSLSTTKTAGNMLVSSSRDNKVLVWDLKHENIPQEDEEIKYGRALKSLSGHGHYVADVALSFDGDFVLSGSWDNTVRLWDLSSGECPPTFSKKKHFEGHTHDVLSVAFSADNRQIISGSRDHTIRLWNTRGQCKYVMGKTVGKKGSDKESEGHTDWVSCVRFSPNVDFPVFVSGGWDKMVKVWSLNNCKQMYNLIGHSGYVNTVTISPDSSLCASGGRDGTAMLWDLKEGKHLYSLEAGEIINSMCFSPNRYWLCAATPDSIIVWDLESKEIVDKLTVDWGDSYAGRRATKPQCTSLAWGEEDGDTLFAGYSDGNIRVWRVQA